MSMALRRHRSPVRVSAAVFLAVVGSWLATQPAHAIVGGAPAAAGQWPWMVAILDTSEPGVAAWQQYCGGVVIARRRVLTAAHCAAGQSARDTAVLVGRTRLTASGGRKIGVASISVDPKWVDRSGRNLDAAILRLKRDAGVPPLSLAARRDAQAWPPGTLAWVLGWGQLNAKPSPDDDDFFADRLRQLQEPVQSDDACEGVFGIGIEDLPYIAKRVLCAGTGDGTSGTCYGDSGGPLVVGTPSGPLDIGIVVANTGCAARGYFDLYTRVDAIRSFALGARAASQPDIVSAPHVVGRLSRGRIVRCAYGRWRGAPTHYSVRWTHADNRRHAEARGRRHRVTAADERHGLRCSVTARNRGGYMTASSRAVRAARTARD